MLTVREAIVVEGRYDKIKLSGLVNAAIIETGGFRVFSDREKQALIRQIAAKNGILVLTDSDGAGFVIRNFLRGVVPPEQIGKRKAQGARRQGGLARRGGHDRRDDSPRYPAERRHDPRRDRSAQAADHQSGSVRPRSCRRSECRPQPAKAPSSPRSAHLPFRKRHARRPQLSLFQRRINSPAARSRYTIISNYEL